MFSTVKILKGVMSLVFPEGSQSQILYDVDFADITMVSPSNRSCKWSVMAPGKECHPSMFSHSYQALHWGANYVLGVLLQISCLVHGILSFI